MGLIDYTGKLNEYKDYLDMLNMISKRCKYMEIVIIDSRRSNELIDRFNNYIIYTKKVSNGGVLK